MDFHPIIVHFPIALLAAYSILEFLRFENLQKHASWFYLKLFMLLSGTLSAGLALQTGEFAEEKYARAARQVIRMHSAWASVTAYIFVILAFVYVMKWLEKDFSENGLVLKLKSNRILSQALETLVRISSFPGNPAVIVGLSIFGFLSLIITGALGGAIVYGPDTDIFISFIYKLFF